MADLASIESLRKVSESQLDALRNIEGSLTGSGTARGRGGGRNRGVKVHEAETKARQKSIDAIKNMQDALIDGEGELRAFNQISRQHQRVIANTINDLNSTVQNTKELSAAEKARYESELQQIQRQARARNLNASSLLRLTGINERLYSVNRDGMDTLIDTNRKAAAFGETLTKLSTKATEAWHQFANASAAIANVTMGFNAYGGDLEHIAKKQIDAAGIASDWLEAVAIKNKVSHEAYVDALDDSITATLGSANTFTSLKEANQALMMQFGSSQEELYKYTANHNLSLKMMTDTMNLFAEQGIKVPIDVMRDQMMGKGGVIDTMNDLAIVTNTSVEEITGMVRGMMQDGAMRAELLTLSQSERKDRVKSLIQRTKELAVTGMGIERAMEFQKTLARINQDSDPKTFMRNIYRTAAIGGVMGVDQSLIGAYREAMMNPNAPGSQQTIQRFMTAMQERRGQMMGGGFGEQMLARQLNTIMDSESRQMRDVGGTAADIAKEMKAPMAALESKAAEGNEYLKEIKSGWDWLKTILDDPAVKMGWGAMQGLGALLNNIPGLANFLGGAAGGAGLMWGAGKMAKRMGGAPLPGTGGTAGPQQGKQPAKLPPYQGPKGSPTAVAAAGGVAMRLLKGAGAAGLAIAAIDLVMSHIMGPDYLKKIAGSVWSFFDMPDNEAEINQAYDQKKLELQSDQAEASNKLSNAEAQLLHATNELREINKPGLQDGRTLEEEQRMREHLVEIQRESRDAMVSLNEEIKELKKQGREAAQKRQEQIENLKKIDEAVKGSDNSRESWYSAGDNYS